MINSLHAGYFFMPLSSADFFFQNCFFSKNPFRNTIRVPNGLDPDQDQHCVGSDLGSNCLQMLSADNEGRR